MKTKIVLLALTLAFSLSTAQAQKVKVGFDKSADFSKYHTYSWVKTDPSVEPTMRRLLVMMEVDGELNKKGLQKVEEGGDLLISGGGGFAGGIGGEHQGVVAPSASAGLYPYTGVWTGAPYAPGSMVVEGALQLEFADFKDKHLVWAGTVTTKLDTDNRQKLIERIRIAVGKLLDKYPPKK